ncbi:hypothetical protein BDZ45DRAFT_725937 [Acephala macrosclerotiorum]|nr:hypothetical protein BDZ45DRAFT_725937 [Acephala macrosclerotiorum]
MASQFFTRLSSVAAKYSPISIVVSAAVVAASTTYSQNAAHSSMKKSIIYPRLSDSGYEKRLNELEKRIWELEGAHNESVDAAVKVDKDNVDWMNEAVRRMKEMNETLEFILTRLERLERRLGEEGCKKGKK